MHESKVQDLWEVFASSISHYFVLFTVHLFTNSKKMCVPIVLRPPPGSFASIWISSTWQGTYKSSQTKIQLIMPRLLSTLNIPISLYILYSKPLLFTLAWYEAKLDAIAILYCFWNTEGTWTHCLITLFCINFCLLLQGLW